MEYVGKWSVEMTDYCIPVGRDARGVYSSIPKFCHRNRLDVM